MIANEMTEKLSKFNIDLSAMFVPFSLSRNANGKYKSLNWVVRLSRNGHTLKTDYSAGVAYIPEYSQRESRYQWYADYVAKVCETGKYLIGDAYGRTNLFDWQGKPLPGPALPDILWSLLLDASLAEVNTFSDWCRDLGYSDDSISALNIYNQCVKNGQDLARMFSPAELSELGEIFQDY